MRQGYTWAAKVVWVAFAFSSPGLVADGLKDVKRCSTKDVTFHVGSNDLDVLNRSVIDKMVNCAGMVTLNVPENSPSGRTLAGVISDIHKRRPGLPVLIYTWITRWHETSRYGSRINEDMDSIEGAFINPPLHLHERKGMFPSSRTAHYFDLSKEKVRERLIDRVVDAIEFTGADGVFLDMTFVEPTGPALKRCRKEQACKAYSEGVRKVLSLLKQRVGKKLVIINGVFTGTMLDLHAQESLLKYVDGVMIEYFGLNPNAAERKRAGHPQDFGNGIQAYWKLVDRHPDKWFLVYGRAPWLIIPESQHDKWGEYLYMAYLMVAGQNTLFKYHASFQVPPHKGNSGGMDMLEQRKLVNLGRPLARREKSGDVWWRLFEKGVVLLCPHDKQQPCVTRGMASRLRDCSVPSMLKPGEGRIISSCRYMEGAANTGSRERLYTMSTNRARG